MTSNRNNGLSRWLVSLALVYVPVAVWIDLVIRRGVASQEALGAAQLFTTVGLIAITGYYAWQTRQQVAVAQAAVLEARRSAEAQAAAYVHLYFDVPWGEESSTSLVQIVLANTGRSAARDVRVTFEPALRSGFSGYPAGELPLPLAITEGLAYLPPGHEERTSYWAAQDLFSTEKGLPQRYRVSLRYVDTSTDASHEIAYDLDFAAIQNRLGRGVPAGFRRPDESLSRISDALESVAKTLGKPEQEREYRAYIARRRATRNTARLSASAPDEGTAGG
jgi:hypothetical protein